MPGLDRPAPMTDLAAVSVRRTHAVVASLLDPPTDLPVLDVGAGAGNFTAHLEANGYRAVAIDIDPDDYYGAGWSRAPFLQANLDEALPVHDGSASGAVCIEVLEHLESPLRALRLMSAALVPGGFIILTTPNTLSWVSRLELLVRGHHESFDDRWYDANGHISPVSLTQITRLGKRAGLSVEAVTYNVARLPIPRLSHERLPLMRPRFLRQALGVTLIAKLRKTGPPVEKIMRG